MTLSIILLVVLTIVFIVEIWNLVRDIKKTKELYAPQEVKIKLINGGKLPEFKTDGAVCCDGYARMGKCTAIIEPRCRTLIPLGFAVELPEGYEAIIRPRSGNSKMGIDICQGTIDVDYRGEVMACVVNNSIDDIRINDGDRICQIAIREVPKINFVTVEELSETERGSKGFGSSGLK